MKRPRHIWWIILTYAGFVVFVGLVAYVAVMLPPCYSVLVATAIVLAGFLAVAFGEVGGADGRTRAGRCSNPGDRLEGRHEEAAGDIVGHV